MRIIVDGAGESHRAVSGWGDRRIACPFCEKNVEEERHDMVGLVICRTRIAATVWVR